MLLVDKRIGSGELAEYLGHLKIPVLLTTLAFGDLALMGNGPGGEPTPIGIERKALKDFVTSMLDGRLPGHQLPGLLAEYRETWIVVEGSWRIDHQTGFVLVPGYSKKFIHGGSNKGHKTWKMLETSTDHGLPYRDLEAMFLTLELKGGVRLRHTFSKVETCRFAAALYRWWTEKTFEQHRSHLRFHSEHADKALLIKPSPCRRLAACLPGIGWEKSGAVAGHFGHDPLKMTLATAQDWQTIPGIGKTLADRVVRILQQGAQS